MNTIQTYTGPSLFNMPSGMEPTKIDLAHRIQVLEDVLQSVIEHLAESGGLKEIGVIAVPKSDGVKIVLVKGEKKDSTS